MNNVPLVIKIENKDINETSLVGLTVDNVKKYYSKEVVEKYGIFDFDGGFCVLFPNIVVSDTNPMIHKISADLTSIFKKIGYDSVSASIVTDLFPYLKYEDGNLDKIIEFKVGFLTNDDERPSRIMSFSEEMISSYLSKTVTENTIVLSLNRFDYIMDLLNLLDNGFDIFRKNIQVFCSAFVKFHRDENYERRKDENFMIRNQWITFASKFSATETDSIKAYDETDSYSYSILTIEEILKDESNDLKALIDKYNGDLFEDKVRKVFCSKDEITLNDMHILFAEYIRRDHFHCEDEIYCFKYPINAPVKVNDLSPLVNSFLNLIKAIKEKMFLSYSEIDESENQERSRITSKHQMIVKAFSNDKRNSMIKNSCANYLHIPKLTKGSALNKIVFKDYCYEYVIIDSQKTLTHRKSYMEDRFIAFINIDNIQNFGKTDRGQKAVENVYRTYKRMFKYQENVDFFISWLGSIITRNPERCILFMMGKDGENAKTSVINALAEALGNNPHLGYAKTYQPSMFYPNNKGGVTCDPYWAIAEGALLASLPETNSRYPFSGTVMKEVSGGDMKMAAQKFKDPIVFKHSAKLVISANDWIAFDNFDKALQSRMFPLICHGKFKQNISDVPESEEEQDRLGIYLADPHFWNSEHIKAQIWIMLNDGFEMYKKNGLKRNKYMEDDLAEWLINTSNYVKFSLDISNVPPPEGGSYITPVDELRNCFMKKFNKYDISIEDFMSNFERETGRRHITIDGKIYYEFKHKDLPAFHLPEKSVYGKIVTEEKTKIPDII